MRALSALNNLPNVEVPDPLGVALWTLPLQTLGQPKPELAGRLNQSANLQRLVQYPTLPTGLNKRLYMNDGLTILALDQNSGQVIWRYQPEKKTMSRVVHPAMQRGNFPLDQRGLSLSDRHVVGVVGVMPVWSMQPQRLASNTLLACVDRTTGEPVWEVSASSLDHSLKKSFFHGSPIAYEGLILVPVRRSQISGFQDAFVVAVDAATGALVWKRHISSAAFEQRYMLTKLSQLMEHRGRLYVVDHLGAAACLDAGSGALYWLSQLPHDTRKDERGHPRARASQHDPPIMLPAGLLIPCSPTRATALVLNPATGQVREVLGESGQSGQGVDVLWSTSDYVVGTGREAGGMTGENMREAGGIAGENVGGVLLVGSMLGWVDGQTLEMRWTTALDGDGTQAIRGRAVVTPRRAYIPTDTRVVEVDLTDGKIVRSLAYDEPGNLLAMDGQMVVASATAVRSYITWDRAYRQLTMQIESRPTDPTAALALAHLAVRADEMEVVIEGIDLAMAASQRAAQAMIDRAPGDDVKLFDEILVFTEPAMGLSSVLRLALFDRLARVTQTPDDEVAYHLHFASLLEELERGPEAVDHYQAVLSNPGLAGVLHQRGSVSRQARIEATVRLKALIDEAGPEIYARYAEEAQHQLVLLRQENVSAEALIELARAYPMSATAPEALASAALDYASQGRTAEAIYLLRQAEPLALDMMLQQQIQSSLAALRRRHDRPRVSPPLLGTRVLPGRPLVPTQSGNGSGGMGGVGGGGMGGGAKNLFVTLTSVPYEEPGSNAGAVGGNVGRNVEGNVGGDVGGDVGGNVGGAMRFPQARTARSLLRLFDTTVSAPRWEKEVDLTPTELRLLSSSNGQWLFYHRGLDDLFAVDERDGTTVWHQSAIRDMLDALGGESVREADRPEAQRAFLDLINNRRVRIRNGAVEQVMDDIPQARHVLVGALSVCVVDERGGAMGIDRRSGRVLWQQLLALDHVTHAVMSADTLVVAGMTGLGTDAKSGALVSLDPMTGEARLPTITGDDGYVWVGIGGPNLLVGATSQEVTAYQLDDGAVAWRLGLPVALDGMGQASYETALLSQRDGRAMVLDMATGRVLLRLGLGLERMATGMPLRWQQVDDDWFVLDSSRTQRVDGNGRVQWVDVQASPTFDAIWQSVGHQTVVRLSQQRPTNPMAMRGAQMERFINDPDALEVGLPVFRERMMRVRPDLLQRGVAVDVVVEEDEAGAMERAVRRLDDLVEGLEAEGEVEDAREVEGNVEVEGKGQAGGDEIGHVRRPVRGNRVGRAVERGGGIAGESGGGYLVHVFEREGGRLLAEREIAAIPEAVLPEATMLLEGCLILGTEEHAVVVTTGR